MANQNHFLDCICCAIVAIAARQGESSRLNSRNVECCDGCREPRCDTPVQRFTASSASLLHTFARTPIVETIASFAVKPEREAATGCHSPKPSGANRGAIAPPMIASRLSAAVFYHAKSHPSTNPNPARNHMTTHAKEQDRSSFDDEAFQSSPIHA